MKNIIRVAMLCLACNLAHAQNDPKVFKFISQVVKDDIVYADSIRAFNVSFMRKGIQSNKTGIFYKMREDSLIWIDSTGKRIRISGHRAAELYRKSFSTKTMRIPEDSLIITEKEKAYINTEISKMSHYKWNDILLMNWQMIPTAMISRAFKNHDGWADLQKKGIDRIYTIGVPIFLRGDTYCLFYYGYSCSGRLCGQGEFAIYKKQDGLWAYWTQICFWIS